MPQPPGGRVEGAPGATPPVLSVAAQCSSGPPAGTLQSRPCGRRVSVAQATPGPCERLTGVGPPPAPRMGCKTGEAGPWEVAVT